MATNLCSRTRTQYIRVKDLAEELSVTVQQIYKEIKRPEFSTCVKKVGSAGIRIDKQEYYRIAEQIYR